MTTLTLPQEVWGQEIKEQSSRPPIGGLVMVRVVIGGLFNSMPISSRGGCGGRGSAEQTSLIITAS